MSDESYSFTTARARLEEIVVQVRKKDTSLEKSLDLLEEGVRLANACTELIDHADWTAGGAGEEVADGEGAGPDADVAVEDEAAAVDAEPDDAPAAAGADAEQHDDSAEQPEDEA